MMLINGFLLLLLINKLLAQTVKVKTSEGTVVGFKADDGNYFTFHGIPYGGDTSGELRFKEAPPPSKYEELIANRTDIICAQPSSSGLIGIEDCLTLNIFTNNFTTNKPILIWISGENFADTNSTRVYSYKTLIESDIVVVEVNYRLSVFGFLCLGVDEAPGNAGIKDVLKALKWIKINAQAFGGDPNNVVLLGHGSGAAIVDLLILSSQCENLVHRAIVLSGSALSPWAIAYKPIENARTLGLNLGINETDVHRLVKGLKAVNSAKLVKEINTFQLPDQSVPFAPCVENSALIGSFLNDAPINWLKLGAYKPIPYIAGFVVQEGTMKLKEAIDHKWLARIQENLTDFLPADLKFVDESSKAKFADKLRKYYFQNPLTENSTLDGFLDFEGESSIKYPIVRTINERIRVSSDSVRLLIFEFQEDGMTWEYDNVKVNGPRHGNILDYIFDARTKTVDNRPKETLIQHFRNFIKTGNASAYNAWFPITSKSFAVLVIKGKKNMPYGVELDFDGVQTKAPWDEIMSLYYRVPIPVSSATTLIFSFLLLIICQILVIL